MVVATIAIDVPWPRRSSGGEVGPGVAGLQVRRRAGTVDEQRDEEERRVVEHGGNKDTDGAEAAGEEPGGQAGASAEPSGGLAHKECCEGGTEGEQTCRQAGEAVRAEHLLRQQGTDGDARCESRAAENLTEDHDPQCALVDTVDVDSVQGVRSVHGICVLRKLHELGC